MSDTSFEIELNRTSAAQAAAADPGLCVWVSANAGTGKTHVLTQRVLRLLLSGTAPERILCLTYTKAAAAEMSKRLFDTLAKWVTMEPGILEAALSKLTGSKPDTKMIARARTLFTAAIETPGGLKVQTIHAFCERLLQRFPLEAGVTPSFSILDDDTTRKLTREAIDTVLAECTDRPNSEIGQALKTAVGYVTDASFDEVMEEALRHRAWLDEAVRMPADVVGTASGFDRVEALFRQTFAVRPGVTVANIETEASQLFSPAALTRISSVLQSGKAQDLNFADMFKAAEQAVSKAGLIAAYDGLFFKSDGNRRDKFLTKDLARDNPDADETLRRAQEKFVELSTELKSLNVVAATMALHRLAARVIQIYTEAKAQRASLDFDDLIVRTRSLLATGSTPEWVMFKLDNGLDHILVDESQDTSPAQWAVIEALADEFFAGRGAGDRLRTVFAVGDEKQSIYSFQGAAPEMFATVGRRFEASAVNAGLAWRQERLHMSFRTVDAVLGAVDSVFSDPARTPGLMTGSASLQHVPYRQGHAGLVEVWDTEKFETITDADAWSPLEETAVQPPAVRLANRIALTIKDWLDRKEILPSVNRPVRPGDILILVRKRNPFAGPMVAALKALRIDVAGADRIDLTGQIAVQDLMSLGDMLTVPDDDLALAEILKSPVFGLTDDDLLDLCYKRKGTLWRSLLAAADVPGSGASKYKFAAVQLKAWRRIADFAPPFEFFASVLDKDGVRKKLLARLGPDASDALDEFLNLALTYDDGAPPSLSGFLFWLRDGTRQIKRDMDHGRNEVRVMTVHGAKGLEAPIVFLPDTCSARSAQGQGGKPLAFEVLSRPIGAPPAFVWAVAGTSKLPPVAAARHAIEQSGAEERDRLLYVAMTRARDRLYIAGFEGKKGIDAGCWYETITEALGPRLKTVELPDGTEVRRVTSEQSAGPVTSNDETPLSADAGVLPPWVLQPAPREPQLSVPLAPSRLAPYETSDDGDPLPAERKRGVLDEPAASPPHGFEAKVAGVAIDDTRFLRGTLTHALLQHLPAFPKERRRDAASTFVAVRGAKLAGRIRSNIIAEALAVLDHPEFGALFGPGSRAEVPIVAEIPRPKGSPGLPLKLTGQIDRLAVTQNNVLIVDFKTNRMPPESLSSVAEVYLYQLAAYALALKQIYPEHRVRAALLWTQSATLMEVPPALLDGYATKLWQLDPGKLDA